MTYVGFQHRATIICGLLNLFHADVGAVPNPASQLRRRADLVPLLATIKNTPELSVFYSLFNSTGGKRIPLSLYRVMLIRAPGDSGIPGPQLEERFNDPKVGLEFTAFAPTNDVRSRLSLVYLYIADKIPGFCECLARNASHTHCADIL